MAGAGSSSSSSGGDASSTSATEKGPRADPEPPTDDDIYVVAVPRKPALVVASRLRVQPGRTETGPTVIFVESDDGHYYPIHTDDDADDGAQDDDDARGGFGFGAVPASGVAMACQPETTVVGELARERGKCAVCMDLKEHEAAGDAARTTMPCAAHGFHERSCIFGWLRRRLCPRCRRLTRKARRPASRRMHDDDGRRRGR